MTITNEKFSVTLQGNDVVDLTSRVEGLVRNLKIQDMQVNVSVNSAVSSIILSNDIGQIDGIMSPMEKLAPADNDNYPFLRSTLLGKNVSLPVVNREIQILQYQKIFLINFDYKSSVQDVVVSLIYNEQNGQE